MISTDGRGDEAHIWVADPEKGEDVPALLSGPEGEWCARLRAPEQRRRCNVAWALVRHGLSQLAEVDPSALLFARDTRGRPELVAPMGTGLRFSLATTRGLVACAVARSDVGIDVERVKVDRVTDAVARRVLASSELIVVRSQADRFFDFWTLKEAYLKARGLGLTLGLNRIAFRLGDPVSVELDASLEEDAGAWQFALLERPDLRLGLAVRRPGLQRVRIVTHGWQA